MTKAIDPIFAPVPYGDDRQVTRTRRGVHCITEMKYDKDIVYCRCHSCSYEWEVAKSDYIKGNGPPPNQLIEPTHIEHIGVGGTGDFQQFGNYTYGHYTQNAHECCTGGMGLCEYKDQVVQIGEFYQATGMTGSDGNLTGGTGGNGEWLGGFNQDGSPIGPFSDSTSLYMVCRGGSGDSSLIKERMFGGYPLICPNCCKVNFESKFIEPKDNPGKQRFDLTQRAKDLIPGLGEFELPELQGNPICNAIIVIDFQRIKSNL